MAEALGAVSGAYNKLIEWLLGRNMLLGVASLCLLCISGFATWHGMTDFVLGVQSDQPVVAGEVAGLSIATETLILAVTMVLTFLMWLALRETVAPQHRWHLAFTMPLYVMLAMWSVGFGYGYWWSIIAGEAATREGLQGQAEDVRNATVGVAARLAAVKSRLDGVSSFSDRQMAQEEAYGGSCGVESAAGRGEFWQARQNVRDSVNDLSTRISANWLAVVQAELDQLIQAVNGAGSVVSGQTTTQRQAEYERASAEIRGRAFSIAARSDALGDAFAADMRALANRVSQEPGQTGFTCYDPNLADRLREAAQEAAQPAQITFRDASFSEGAAGVANAVSRMWSNAGGLAVWIWNGLTGGTSQRAASDQDGMNGRDLVSLIAALGVDFGLLVIALLNPPIAPPPRSGLLSKLSRFSAPSERVVRELATAMRTAIQIAPTTNLAWVRMHFVHHKGRTYYATPDLGACNAINDSGEPSEEGLRGLALNQLAGVLTEHGLIRNLTDSEADRLEQAQEASKTRRSGQEDYEHERALKAKVSRALAIAGWGEKAQNTPEIYPLEEGDSFTPILNMIEKGDAAQRVKEASASAKRRWFAGGEENDAKPEVREIVKSLPAPAPKPETEEAKPRGWKLREKETRQPKERPPSGARKKRAASGQVGAEPADSDV